MSNLMILGLVLGVSLGVIATILVLFPLLKKKNIKTDEILAKVDTALTGADGVIGIADKVIPNNPIINVLKLVEKYVHIGVGQAEQLYLASNLSADERNAKAKDTINTALKMLNIEITPEIDKIIDGSIESEVLALGHKPVDEKAKEAQVQSQIQTIQQQNTDLQNQNTQLKNTIQAVQNTVQTVQ